MDLKQLAYFVAVADARSFTAAAAQLGVGQPAASTAIRRLEEELEVELFRRTAQAVELTDAGSALLPDARLSIAAAQRGREAVRAVAGGSRGKVRFGVLEVLPGVNLAALLAAFNVRHPRIEARALQVGASGGELLEQVLDGTIDFAIVATLRPAPPGVRMRELGGQDYHLLVAEDHPRITSETVTPHELAQEPFVGFPSRNGQPTDLDVLFAHMQIAPQVPFEASRVDTMLDLVRAGNAAAILPRVLLRFHAPGIRAVAIDCPGLPRSALKVATPTTRALSAPAQELIDELVERLLAFAASASS